MRINSTRCEFNHKSRIIILCAEYDPKNDVWEFWSELSTTPIWTKSLVKKHAHAIGSLKSFSKVNRGNIRVQFDRHPNLSQLARFIELCVSETCDE